jgi:hypothetical protein
LEAGGVATPEGWRLFQHLDRDLVALKSSPRGSADMLAATIFIDDVSKRPVTQMSDSFATRQDEGSRKEVSVCRNEALLSPGHHPEPAIPNAILEQWQKIVNLMAEMLAVPAGLIMRIQGEEMHVLVSSSTEGNPYHP